MDTQSLRIVPSSRPDPSSVTKSLAATSNSFGVQDTFRYGPKTLHSEFSPSHPLESILNKWEETQTNLKFTMQKRLYGVHAPIRHLMERSIVSKMQRLPALPSSNLGLEILMGKDETIDFEDFLSDPEMSTEMIDVHGSMEHKLGIKF
ncbi:hypothetical protein Glove_330g22 [Diversispora epigaea]|uniref:Proteasome maturation factor UMP1 n=1 Tax=Diversispora epigaea TaxID=1348612 RepID=A0A397HJP6_9GLOM|nr:hypothetical protein Glove_330g22 [Diversispora epigaea]